MTSHDRAAAYLDNFARRVCQEAMAHATRQFWLRRAEEIERARPVPGDYVGRATREELSQQWQRLTEISQACRNRSTLCWEDDTDAELETVWGEVA